MNIANKSINALFKEYRRLCSDPSAKGHDAARSRYFGQWVDFQISRNFKPNS